MSSDEWISKLFCGLMLMVIIGGLAVLLSSIAAHSSGIETGKDRIRQEAVDQGLGEWWIDNKTLTRQFRWIGKQPEKP